MLLSVGAGDAVKFVGRNASVSFPSIVGFCDGYVQFCLGPMDGVNDGTFVGFDVISGERVGSMVPRDEKRDSDSMSAGSDFKSFLLLTTTLDAITTMMRAIVATTKAM